MAKEYIEREALISRINGMGYHEQIKNNLLFIARMIPAADVAPVVRCQDCVYARPLKDMNYDYLCRYWNGHSCNQNQFCSQGKRKEKTK